LNLQRKSFHSFASAELPNTEITDHYDRLHRHIRYFTLGAPLFKPCLPRFRYHAVPFGLAASINDMIWHMNTTRLAARIGRLRATVRCASRHRTPPGDHFPIWRPILVMRLPPERPRFKPGHRS
jgi:hypothetical protein